MSFPVFWAQDTFPPSTAFMSTTIWQSGLLSNFSLMTPGSAIILVACGKENGKGFILEILDFWPLLFVAAELGDFKRSNTVSIT